MLKPQNYENTKPYEETEKLEIGGHICKIMKVEEARSRTGRDMVNIYLDIAEGPQAEYYTRQYREDTRANKKWGCIVYQLVEDNEGNTNRGYKTLLTAVKKSNPGFDESKLWLESGCDYLKGKLIGGVFGREQYLNQKGQLRWSVKCFYFRDVDTVRKGVEPPEDRYLEGNSQAYGEDRNASMGSNYDDLPF